MPPQPTRRLVSAVALVLVLIAAGYYAQRSMRSRPPDELGSADDLNDFLDPPPASEGTIAAANPTPDNPFSNTCDGKSIGFVGPNGEAPRLQFRNVTAGAVLQCRSGPASSVAGFPFTPCDGGAGTRPFHTPPLTAEGHYVTEMREVVGAEIRAPTRYAYYVHHSLDNVKCCVSSHPDSAWFSAARAALPNTGRFDQTTRLDNPFIAISVRTAEGGQSDSLLSLRRAFRFSSDSTLLLIRRTMCSRRTLASEQTESCLGLVVSLPQLGLNPNSVATCPSARQAPYRAGSVGSGCRDVYCTITSCRITANACAQIEYTFTRGPGQQPWVVDGPLRCPEQGVVGFQDHYCQVYVLNSSGQGACLVNDNGVIRSATTITRERLGLAVLRARRSELGGSRYVFSAKTTSPGGDTAVLYLPR